MAVDDGQPFVFLELLVVWLILLDHVGERRMQVPQLHLTVDFFVVVLPTTMLEEDLVEWTIRPISFLQDPEEPVEMYLFYEDFLPFLWILDLLSEGLVLDWPIEPSIFDVISVFVQIDQIKLVLDTSDCHWFGRVGSTVAPLVN